MEWCAARWGSVGAAAVAALGAAAGGAPASLAAAPGLQLLLALLMAPPALPRDAPLRARASRRPARPKPRDLLKVLAFLPASALAFFCLLVLFGAPALSDHEATFSLATLLTILTIMPASLYAGVEVTVSILTGAKWFSGDRFLEMLQQNILLTLLGAWCGGIVIPLDWDRPWQVWPIPCYRGAIVGYIFSNIVTHVKLIPSVAKQLSRKPRIGFM